MSELDHDTITYFLMAALYCLGSGIFAIMLGKLLDDGDDGDNE